MEVKCVQDYNDALTETVSLMYKTPKLVGLSAIGDWDQASTRGQFTWWDKESVEKMEEPEKDVDELVMESIRRQFELLQRLHPLRDNLGKGIKDAASVNAVADICLKAPKSIVYRLLLVRFLSNTTEPSACESLRRDKKTAEELFSWCCGAAMDKDTTLLAEGLAVIHSFDYFPRLLYADWQRRLVEDWRDHIDFRVRRAAEDNLWKKT